VTSRAVLTEPRAADFDLRALPDGFYDDPYPWYDALRREAPIKRSGDGGVLLTRYADVAAVYQDTATFSSDKRVEFAPKFGEGRLFRHHTTSLVFNDAPYHTRVRKLIVGALLPRALARREASMGQLVERLLKRMATSDAPDLIADFAGAIPVEVIGDLLQIPTEARAPLRGWSLAILGALEPAPSSEVLERGEAALADFHALLEQLVADRRARPGDPEADLLTRLIQGEVDGERLRHDELLENCVFLLNAGHETTTNLIGNALEALWRFPGERSRLAADPGLLRGAVEEALRFESSNQLGNRITTTATNISGVSVAAGSQVTLCIGAANRDPDAFDRPEVFDITRETNRHVAFGGGPHQCAGMNLARLEARVALAALLVRYPRYEVLPGAERTRRARFRGFKTLPVRLNPSS
jgi:cytochrome P450